MRPKPIRELNALIIIAVCALLLAALCGPVRADDDTVDVMVPCAVAFECVSDLKVANATLSWRFSFHPRRAALYDIVHWTASDSGGRREFVAQIASRQDGERLIRYYRVYEYVRVRNWKWLWLRQKFEWRELGWGESGVGVSQCSADASFFLLHGVACRSRAVIVDVLR